MFKKLDSRTGMWVPVKEVFFATTPLEPISPFEEGPVPVGFTENLVARNPLRGSRVYGESESEVPPARAGRYAAMLASARAMYLRVFVGLSVGEHVNVWDMADVKSQAFMLREVRRDAPGMSLTKGEGIFLGEGSHIVLEDSVQLILRGEEVKTDAAAHAWNEKNLYFASTLAENLLQESVLAQVYAGSTQIFDGFVSSELTLDEIETAYQAGHTEMIKRETALLRRRFPV